MYFFRSKQYTEPHRALLSEEEEGPSEVPVRTDLPGDLKQIVVSLLPANSLRKLYATNKGWRDAVFNEAKRHMQEHLDGITSSWVQELLSRGASPEVQEELVQRNLDLLRFFCKLFVSKQRTPFQVQMQLVVDKFHTRGKYLLEVWLILCTIGVLVDIFLFTGSFTVLDKINNIIQISFLVLSTVSVMGLLYCCCSYCMSRKDEDSANNRNPQGRLNVLDIIKFLKATRMMPRFLNMLRSPSQAQRELDKQIEFLIDLCAQYLKDLNTDHSGRPQQYVHPVPMEP